MCGPPVGGTFQFQIFIQAPSSKIWRKTISNGEGGCWRGGRGWPILAYLLRKKIYRRDAEQNERGLWAGTFV
jgi:hypothetical protein